VLRVIYVGALSVRKGILYLLEAVQDLRLPDFEVWLIGGIVPEVKSKLRSYNGLDCFRIMKERLLTILIPAADRLHAFQRCRRHTISHYWILVHIEDSVSNCSWITNWNDISLQFRSCSRSST
jgi:glycosyltransferase involved in cell wall biosynthesis